METLAKLFGSPLRVKMMRLFLFNPENTYDKSIIASRLHSSPRLTGKELTALEASGLVKKQKFRKDIPKKNKGGKQKKVKVTGFTLNQKFPYLAPIKNLLVDTVLFKHHEIITRFARAGTIKLLIIAGVFIHDLESRVDLLVVGDRIKKRMVDRAVRAIEAELGKELRYAVLETPDFHYRLSVYDKLVRDILEYPHKRLVDKLNPLPAFSGPSARLHPEEQWLFS